MIAMDLIFFLKGLLVGAAIAFPVGPIGILCLRRLLIQGPWFGIASGLGAATADIIFAGTALVGISFLSNHLVHFAFALRLMSSFIIMLLGIIIMYSQPPHAFPSKKQHSILQSYFSTMLLTLANPLIILTFLFLFSAVGINQELDTASELLATLLGVFLGSIIWWLVLSTLAAFFHPNTNPATFSKINRWCGITITSFGILSFIVILLRFFLF